jgi:hypothetical protein
MGEPKNPNTIVIRNYYYPYGLKEIDIWNYYSKNRDKILKEVRGRPILLFMFIKENEYIIKRFYDYKLIRLNSKNYDTIINGRTVSLSVEQEQDKINYFCIDIDSPNGMNDENKLKDCVEKVITFYDNIDMVRKIRVVNSATSYHVYGYIKQNLNTSVAIKYLIKKLNYDLDKEFSINSKSKNNNKINLDLSPMYLRGSHTVPWSLCKNGLVCMDITDTWESFRREDATLKEILK